jgi:hypothetical protein
VIETGGERRRVESEKKERKVCNFWYLFWFGFVVGFWFEKET